MEQDQKVLEGVVEIDDHNQKTKHFPNMSAALEYCRFAMPLDFRLTKRQNGYELNYIMSEGKR